MQDDDEELSSDIDIMKIDFLVSDLERTSVVLVFCNLRPVIGPVDIVAAAADVLQQLDCNRISGSEK